MHMLTKMTQSAGEPLELTNLMPQIIVSAFASELHLKTLEAMHFGGMVTQTHKLDVLYFGLPADIQRRLADGYMKLLRDTGRLAFVLTTYGGPPEKYGLPEAIKRSGDAFVEFRYLFETPEKFPAWTLANLADVAEAVILEDRPDWVKLLDEKAKATGEAIKKKGVARPVDPPPGMPPT